MPTSHQEAQKIVEVMSRHISVVTSKRIAEELNAEVGKPTDNSSLKISLQMLNDLWASVPEETDKKEKRKTVALKLLLALVVFSHAVLIVANLMSMFFLAILAPWYISVPLVTLIVNLTFSPVRCPLTKLEDKIRVKLGMEPVHHFVKHYFVKQVFG